MLKKIEDMNYYELLEVTPRATAQEIHKAYERIRRIYEPNSIALYSLFSSDETEKIRQRVEEAYRTLIYEENRRAYDQALQLTPPSQESVQPRNFAVPLKEQKHEEWAVPKHAPLVEDRPTPPGPASAPAAEPLKPLPADISEFTGSVLRMLREQRGLTIQNVADITKMSTRYIEGIEEENYQRLPARPYLRGFLVNYVKALGYEPENAAASYMKRYDSTKNPLKK